jgi:signal recognition particle subunit SRP54
MKVPIYGNPNEKNSLKIAIEGVEGFRQDGFEVILLDTAGRHKDEKTLINEMSEIAQMVKPDETILVIDATIGQQAYVQAKAFHEATRIGSIFVSKLDGDRILRSFSVCWKAPWNGRHRGISSAGQRS